jgi:predicted nucleotidyltransferase
VDVTGVIRVLNQLKRQRRIRDYAIFGAVASAYYMEAISTVDVDVIIAADTDLEYAKARRSLANMGDKAKDFGVIVAGTEVRLQPTSISPLYESALKHAKAISVGGVRTKIVDREHLILLALRANRPKDRVRASILLLNADRSHLERLLEEFDTDGKIKALIATLY